MWGTAHIPRGMHLHLAGARPRTPTHNSHTQTLSHTHTHSLSLSHTHLQTDRQTYRQTDTHTHTRTRDAVWGTAHIPCPVYSHLAGTSPSRTFDLPLLLITPPEHSPVYGLVWREGLVTCCLSPSLSLSPSRPLSIFIASPLSRSLPLSIATFSSFSAYLPFYIFLCISLCRVPFSELARATELSRPRLLRTM